MCLRKATHRKQIVALACKNENLWELSVMIRSAKYRQTARQIVLEPLEYGVSEMFIS